MATGGKALGSASSTPSDLRTEFKTKEGLYKNVKPLQYCRPKKQPLVGEELSPTRISLVTAKDARGQKEWMVFNSGRELYCYPFEGVERVSSNPVLDLTSLTYSFITAPRSPTLD